MEHTTAQGMGDKDDHQQREADMGMLPRLLLLPLSCPVLDATSADHQWRAQAGTTGQTDTLPVALAVPWFSEGQTGEPVCV